MMYHNTTETEACPESHIEYRLTCNESHCVESNQNWIVLHRNSSESHRICSCFNVSYVGYVSRCVSHWPQVRRCNSCRASHGKNNVQIYCYLYCMCRQCKMLVSEVISEFSSKSHHIVWLFVIGNICTNFLKLSYNFLINLRGIKTRHKWMQQTDYLKITIKNHCALEHATCCSNLSVDVIWGVSHWVDQRVFGKTLTSFLRNMNQAHDSLISWEKHSSNLPCISKSFKRSQTVLRFSKSAS